MALQPLSMGAFCRLSGALLPPQQQHPPRPFRPPPPGPATPPSPGSLAALSMSAQPSLASSYFRGQLGANIKNIDFKFTERHSQKYCPNHLLLSFSWFRVFFNCLIC